MVIFKARESMQDTCFPVKFLNQTESYLFSDKVAELCMQHVGGVTRRGGTTF